MAATHIHYQTGTYDAKTFTDCVITDMKSYSAHFFNGATFNCDALLSGNNATSFTLKDIIIKAGKTVALENFQRVSLTLNNW